MCVCGGGGGEGVCNFARKCISTTPIGAPIYTFINNGDYKKHSRVVG